MRVSLNHPLLNGFILGFAFNFGMLKVIASVQDDLDHTVFNRMERLLGEAEAAV